MTWLLVLGIAAVALFLPPVLADSASPALQAPVASGLLLLRILAVACIAYLALGHRGGWWTSPPEEGTLPEGKDATPSERGGWLAWTIGLVVAAAALRLYGLGAGLWTDEVSTLVIYVRPSFGEILTTFDSQNQHTLFSLLAHATTGLFGESAWSLRLPAALLGTATIVALVLLGREVSDDREAVLSGLVLTLSYQHIWFSQNARGYSGVLFFSLLSSVYFMRALRSGRTRSWAAFAVAVALGMYIHLTMLFVVMAQFAYYLWRVLRKKHEWPGALGRLRPFLVGFVPSGLLTLLLYSPVLPQILGAAESDVSDVATWRSAAWMIREIVGGLGLDATLVGAGVLGLAIVAMGLWSYARKEPVVAWLLLGSVALGGGITIALQHHLWPRFFLFAAGFGVLVVVRGLTASAELAGTALRLSPKRRQHLATALTLGMILVLGRSLPYVYRPKQDFGGARDFVVAAAQPGDTIVTTGVAASPYRLYYEPDWGSVTSLEDLREVQRRAERVWLIYTLPIQLRDNQPDLLDVLEADFEVVGTFSGSLGGGAVFVVRGPGTAASDGS